MLHIRVQLGSEGGNRLVMPALACVTMHVAILLSSRHASPGRLLLA